MKIRFHAKLGEAHSWCYTQHDIIRAIRKIGGHEVFLKSTDNLKHLPDDLKDLLLPGYHGALIKGPTDFITENGEQIKVDPKIPLKEISDKDLPYDLELAYTILFQGPRRFLQTSKCRAIIWNFESSALPEGWNEYIKSIDFLLPSSQYSYDIFAQNGIPKDKMVLVPHGVDTTIFNPNIPPFQLRTEKKIKFLHNARPHARKLHNRVINTYLDTFTGNDDVCLVLKTKFLTPSREKPFEVDVKQILQEAYKGRKNPPEIEIVNTVIPEIGALYNACDVVVSMSSCEGFWCPGLEALACEKLVIAPRHGGQLDFLNDNNSLLIDTKEMKAELSHQYWTNSEKAVVGDPSCKHFAQLLRRAYENLEEEKKRIFEPSKETVKKFSWENAAKIILDLPIPSVSKRINTKRKVLYIIPYSMVGGAEVWVKEAIEKLDRDVYEPHLAFVNGYTKEAEKLFGNLNVEINDLSNSGKLHGLKCLCESGNYDIINFYNSFSVYQILRSCWDQGYRGRIVETIHSDLVWNDSMTKVSSRDKLVCMMMTVSEPLTKKIIGLGNKNVFTLPAQTNWDRFKLPRSKDIFDEFNIPKDFVIGFVGRFSPEKNISTILQCARGMPNASFVLIGDGPQFDIFKKISSNLKNVFILGKRSDVEKFYPAFDVLFLPSTMEGLPLVILESMISGTPTVASNVGAISEIVKDDINGLLCEKPNDYLIFTTLFEKVKENWNKYSKNSLIISKSLEERSKTLTINTLYNMLFKGGK